jgi:hypothetical protein
LTGKEAQGYMQPALDLFGADMLAGTYQSASIPTMGLEISLDLVGMVAPVTDTRKNHTVASPTGFTPSTYQTATIFGGQGTTVVDSRDSILSYRSPDGILNTAIAPIVVPQLRVGSLYGTEVMIRFFQVPKSLTKSFPDITLFGAGIRHNLSQYFPTLPVDLAAGAFYTTFTTGDLADFRGYSFGIHASKGFAVLTLYGGLDYEASKLKLQYTSRNAVDLGQDIEVRLDGQNTFRITAGAKLSLGVFHLFGDVNLGQVTHFSGGIGLGL